MKNRCLIFFVLLLLAISRFYSLGLSTSSNNYMATKAEYEDLIEYLAEKSNSSEEKPENALDTVGATTFIQTKLESTNRGTGCEAMNLCSGKGSCRNGACVCDEGFDYFDCSVNVLSKNSYLYLEKCPNSCNFHGECVDGHCICDPGWIGDNCSMKKCDEDCNAHGRCIVR